MSYFVGIDQSLTSTGIVVLDETADQSDSMSNVGSKKARGGERLALIANALEEQLEMYKPKMAALEGYSIHSVNRPFDLGEIGGVVRYILHRNDVPYIVVAPSALKKFVTGKGDASKEQMQQAVVTRWSQVIDQNDICDAYGLARVARAYLLGQTTTRSEAEVIHELKKSKFDLSVVMKLSKKNSI